ncbi:MAG TPA: LysM peptidoglycan-binding domain-containing protein [Mycobacterium sp.]|jgi:LysM repeat protein|nr:LysM peptidoglycan-binding domain-containing protein [Mycobacterium sp.]
MARHYMVQAGDTLSEIARRFYGDASLFKALANANEIADPNKIKTGQVLTLPDPPGRWYPVMSSAYFGGVIINTLFVLDVPAGMRLVIENISGRYTGRNWVLSAAQLCYEPSDGGLQTWGYFPWIQCGPEHDPPDGDRFPEAKERYFGFSHSVRLYVDGPIVYKPHKGLQMICADRRTGPAGSAYLAGGEYSLSGYLELRSDF